MEFETERLLMRQWKAGDLIPFAELNGDAHTMRYFPRTLTRSESDVMANTCQSLIEERGWGMWAVELKSDRAFLGFVGLHIPKSELPFSPCVEIGWRMLKSYWGNGYATEAARLALDYGFRQLSLDEIVSFTTVTNMPSRKVMERIGMRNANKNFIHPDVPQGHALAEHVLYTMSAREYQSNSRWLV